MFLNGRKKPVNLNMIKKQSKSVQDEKVGFHLVSCQSKIFSNRYLPAQSQQKKQTYLNVFHTLF